MKNNASFGVCWLLLHLVALTIVFGAWLILYLARENPPTEVPEIVEVLDAKDYGVHEERGDDAPLIAEAIASVEKYDPNKAQGVIQFYEESTTDDFSRIGCILDHNGKVHALLDIAKGFKIDLVDPNCLTDNSIHLLMEKAMKNNAWTITLRETKP